MEGERIAMVSRRVPMMVSTGTRMLERMVGICELHFGPPMKGKGSQRRGFSYGDW